MNLIAVVQLLEELASLYQELQSDGTVDKIKQELAAGEALVTELKGNQKLVDVVSKLEALGQHK